MRHFRLLSAFSSAMKVLLLFGLAAEEKWKRTDADRHKSRMATRSPRGGARVKNFPHGRRRHPAPQPTGGMPPGRQRLCECSAARQEPSVVRRKWKMAVCGVRRRRRARGEGLGWRETCVNRSSRAFGHPPCSGRAESLCSCADARPLRPFGHIRPFEPGKDTTLRPRGYALGLIESILIDHPARTKRHGVGPTTGHAVESMETMRCLHFRCRAQRRKLRALNGD
jgi:hypothetical protein